MECPGEPHAGLPGPLEGRFVEAVDEAQLAVGLPCQKSEGEAAPVPSIPVEFVDAFSHRLPPGGRKQHLAAGGPPEPRR